MLFGLGIVDSVESESFSRRRVRSCSRRRPQRRRRRLHRHPRRPVFVPGQAPAINNIARATPAVRERKRSASIRTSLHYDPEMRICGKRRARVTLRRALLLLFPDLLAQVALVAHLFDLVDLRLQPVYVLFLILQKLLEQLP